jgi:hypothetical protein
MASQSAVSYMEGVARDDIHKSGMVSDLTPLLDGNKLIQPLHGTNMYTLLNLKNYVILRTWPPSLPCLTMQGLD